MSDDARALARFAVQVVQGGYLLTLEDAGGGVVQWRASEEQLDVLADLIDDALGTAEPD